MSKLGKHVTSLPKELNQKQKANLRTILNHLIINFDDPFDTDEEMDNFIETYIKTEFEPFLVEVLSAKEAEINKLRSELHNQKVIFNRNYRRQFVKQEKLEGQIADIKKVLDKYKLLEDTFIVQDLRVVLEGQKKEVPEQVRNFKVGKLPEGLLNEVKKKREGQKKQEIK